MAEIRISTAGIKFYYAVETTAGTRPTAMSAYTEIPEIVSIPAINETPNTLDCTPLSETKSHLYIPALSDVGGAIGLTANLSDSLMTLWNDTICGAWGTAQASSPAKSMWFVAVVPGMSKAFYIDGQPSPIGMPSTEVDSVYQCTLPIMPHGDMDWYAAPTISG